MILLLLLGISLVGIGTALLARAIANPTLRGAPPVVQIQRYGFTKRRGDRPKVAIGGLFDRAADSVGERFVGRLVGPLGDELRLTLQEQNMGLSINEALANTMARCDTPSMRSFVRSIIQGETLGVSIGQILRDLATEMRRRRKANAEERAQKAPIKILFPLVFLIFPAMFVVLLGPALIQFLHAIRGVAH